MATKKTTKKTTAKKTQKKTSKKTTKKTTKKVTKKKTSKKAASKTAPTFHIFDESQGKFVPAEKPRAFKPKGFDEFQFFIHKIEGIKSWVVSEASSGARIITAKTMKEAKAKAQEALEKVGKEKLASCVNSSVKKNGAAPGFTKPSIKAEKKEASTKSAPLVTQKLRSKILAALVDEKKMPCKQVHLDDIVKKTKAKVPDVTAALMVLEIEGKVKSLPGRMFRMPEVDAEIRARQTGREVKQPSGRAKGKLSMIDAAVEILKDAKQPLCCKEIVTGIFQRKLATSEGRTPHATLSAAMGREISKLGEAARFRRVDRGQYELNA